MTYPNDPAGNDAPGGNPQGQPGWGTPPPPAPQGQPGYGAPQYGAPQYGAPQYPQGGGYAPAPSYAGGPGGAAPTMGFPDAVRSVLGQYVGFSGRARRSEYWWFALFSLLVSIVGSLLDATIGTAVFNLLLSLALLLPSLAVGVRRLHDIGRSGWWLLIAFVPLVGFIVLIVFFCTDSEAGPNRWGPSPKYQPAGY